jgi:hypothetical protein
MANGLSVIAEAELESDCFARAVRQLSACLSYDPARPIRSLAAVHASGCLTTRRRDEHGNWG